MVGILSDSHDNVLMIRQAVWIFNEAKCRLVIHAGDYVAPFSVREMEALRCPVKGVFGNCDGEREGLRRAFESLGEIEDGPFLFRFADLRFLVSHIHEPQFLNQASMPSDILVFGHTHKPLIEKKNGTLLINPGETGGWLTGKSTVALFDPETQTVDIIPLA